MRSFILIFSVFFLNSISLYSQKEISKQEFDKLTDYANCNYTLEIIRQTNNNDNNIQFSKKEVEGMLKLVSLDDMETVISFEELYKLLEGNKSAQELSKKINDRKKQYDESKDDIDLINILKAKNWEGIDLTKTSLTITSAISKNQSEINEKDNPNGINKVSAEKKVIQKSEFVTQSNYKSEISKIKNKIFWFQTTIIGLVVLFISLFGFVILYYKNQFNLNNDKSKLKIFLKDLVLNSREFQRRFVLKTDIYNLNENNAKKSTNSLTESEINSIVDRVLECKRLDEFDKNQNNPLSRVGDSASKFFQTKNGNILQFELPNSKGSSFRVFNIINSSAKFEYCGDLVSTDYFEKVCKFENNPAEVLQKTKITTTKPGTVKLDPSGNWIVEVPAVIKFL